MTAEIFKFRPKKPLSKATYKYEDDKKYEMEALAETILDLGNAIRMLTINAGQMVHPVAQSYHAHTIQQLETARKQARWLYMSMEGEDSE